MENEEHDKSRKQQHGFIREPPLREHMVRSEGSWELETYFMCTTIYYQSTPTNAIWTVRVFDKVLSPNRHLYAKKSNVLFHHTAIEHKMNMALQKFAHGETHYCKFKRTALCQNVLHHDNETTIIKQILCRLQKTFFKDQKIKTHLSIFKCFAPCQVDLWAETLSFSAVLPLENTQTSPVAIFFTLMCFLIIQRRSS